MSLSSSTKASIRYLLGWPSVQVYKEERLERALDLVDDATTETRIEANIATAEVLLAELDALCTDSDVEQVGEIKLNIHNKAMQVRAAGYRVVQRIAQDVGIDPHHDVFGSVPLGGLLRFG